jgi:hypothetical protein
MRRDTKKWTLYIASTIAVIILFQITYGLACIQPSNINWLMTVRHDWGTHYLGWAFYKNEHWHFPLGKVTGYNYPVGTNVGFTDSIPLFAIFFKLFAPLLSADFQYFGLWLFLCHLLTAYFTIMLLQLFKVNWIVTLAAVILIAFNPVLVYRGMHPALCAQWLLVASTYVYFLNPQKTNTNKILRYQFILLTLSALINPYLCWMVLGFTLAVPVKLHFSDKAIGWKKIFSYLAISILAMAIVWYLVGFFDFGKKSDLGIRGAFGLYSMNLNSLFNSGGFSLLLPQLKQVSWHQYEGYMYLGVGFMILIAGLISYFIYVLIRQRLRNQKIKNEFRFINARSIPLIVVAIAYAVLAIALVFTFNDKVLFRIPAPLPFIILEEIFRACARFFWVPYYFILLFTIIGISKIPLKSVITSVFIILALSVQLYDISRLLKSKEMSYGTYTPPMDNSDWISLMDQFDEILFFPAFDTPNIRNMAYQDFSYLALKAGKPVNLAYVARGDTKAMQSFTDSLTRDVQSGNLSPKAVYITNAAHLVYFSKAWQMNRIRLNYMDGCFYIFSKAINNSRLDSLTTRVNAINKSKLDSAIADIGNRTEFTESLPIATEDNKAIHYNLESQSISGDVISFSGWAFIDSTQNNERDSIFVSLSSGSKSYLAAATTSLREDLNGAFNKKNISNAGFKFLGFTDSVQKGNYKVGLVIKDALGRLVTQPVGIETPVKQSLFIDPVKISQLPAQEKINYDMILNDDGSTFSAGGWAARENQDAVGCEISLIIINDQNIYMARADPALRPDVTASFNNKYKLDSSGYRVRLLKSALPKGKYKLGLMIEDLSHRSKSFTYTDKEIVVQ